MPAGKKVTNKRLNTRLDRSLQISLLDQAGKTVNISSSGVYLEIITDDIHSFVPGTKLPIQINAAPTTPGRKGKGIQLEGEALVIRSDIKDVTDRGNRLGIALEFRNKLHIVPDST